MSADPCSLTLLETLRGLCREDHYLGIDDLPEEFEEVEESEWTQDHKYQSAYLIVRDTTTGRHFRIDNSRSGSYHSDWYYSKPEVFEVYRHSKMVEQITWETNP